MNDQPAFPLNTPKWHESVSDKGFDGIDFTMGMTLRDYFAAKALQAQISMPETLLAVSKKTITSDQVCGSCYEWADAMMKARDG